MKVVCYNYAILTGGMEASERVWKAAAKEKAEAMRLKQILMKIKIAKAENNI